MAAAGARRGGPRPGGSRRGSRRVVRGYGAPTWIDLWVSETSTVVFLHGDVVWDEVLEQG